MAAGATLLATGETWPIYDLLAHGDYSAARPDGAAIGTPSRLDCQAGRPNLPRYVITWSGHVQACVQGWPSRNRGVFPAVDHDRSRT